MESNKFIWLGPIYHEKPQQRVIMRALMKTTYYDILKELHHVMFG